MKYQLQKIISWFFKIFIVIDMASNIVIDIRDDANGVNYIK